MRALSTFALEIQRGEDHEPSRVAVVLSTAPDADGVRMAGNIVGALSSTLGFFLTIMMSIVMWVALVAVPVVFLFLWVAGYF